MRVRHLSMGIAIIIALATAGAVAGLGILWWQHRQPVTLPEPGGRYAVGRMQFDWRDPARVDPFAPAAGTSRELTVWIWYPAARGTRGTTVDYMPAPLRMALDRHAGPVIRLL